MNNKNKEFSMILLISAALGAVAGFGISQSVPSTVSTAANVIGLPKLLTEHQKEEAEARHRAQLESVKAEIERLNGGLVEDDYKVLEGVFLSVGHDLVALTQKEDEPTRSELVRRYGPALTLQAVPVPLYDTLLLTPTEERAWAVLTARLRNPDAGVREAAWRLVPYYLLLLVPRHQARAAAAA